MRASGACVAHGERFCKGLMGKGQWECPATGMSSWHKTRMLVFKSTQVGSTTEYSHLLFS